MRLFKKIKNYWKEIRKDIIWNYAYEIKKLLDEDKRVKKLRLDTLGLAVSFYENEDKWYDYFYLHAYSNRANQRAYNPYQNLARKLKELELCNWLCNSLFDEVYDWKKIGDVLIEKFDGVIITQKENYSVIEIL